MRASTVQTYTRIRRRAGAKRPRAQLTAQTLDREIHRGRELAPPPLLVARSTCSKITTAAYSAVVEHACMSRSMMIPFDHKTILLLHTHACPACLMAENGGSLHTPACTGPPRSLVTKTALLIPSKVFRWRGEKRRLKELSQPARSKTVVKRNEADAMGGRRRERVKKTIRTWAVKSRGRTG